MKQDRLQYRQSIAHGDNREWMMYMVYWTLVDDGTTRPDARLFESDDMSGAMKLMEELRTRQRSGEGVCFVTLSSENPDAVGHAGVAETGPDYSWKKRRR